MAVHGLDWQAHLVACESGQPVNGSHSPSKILINDEFISEGSAMFLYLARLRATCRTKRVVTPRHRTSQGQLDDVHERSVNH